MKLFWMNVLVVNYNCFSTISHKLFKYRRFHCLIVKTYSRLLVEYSFNICNTETAPSGGDTIKWQFYFNQLSTCDAGKWNWKQIDIVEQIADAITLQSEISTEEHTLGGLNRESWRDCNLVSLQLKENLEIRENGWKSSFGKFPELPRVFRDFQWSCVSELQPQLLFKLSAKILGTS